MDQTYSEATSDAEQGAIVTSPSIPVDAHPKAYLRIMAQQDLQQTDYSIYDGILYYLCCNQYTCKTVVPRQCGYTPYSGVVSTHKGSIDLGHIYK